MRVAATHPLTDPVRIGGPDAVFERPDTIGVIKHLAPHESLVLEGDSADRFHRVLSGTVAGYKATADGRRQIVAFFFPGDLVGLTVSDHYAYGAEAVDRASVCSILRPSKRDLSRQTPASRNDLLVALDREIAAAQERLVWLGRKTARERIACFLLECARRTGTPGTDGNQTVPLPMSQLEIGDYLGLASETVSRVFAKLARDGAIEVLRPFAGVVIRDRRRLESMTDEGDHLDGADV